MKPLSTFLLAFVLVWFFITRYERLSFSIGSDTMLSNVSVCQNDFLIYNNPSRSDITIRFTTEEGGKGRLTIYLEDGRMIDGKEFSYSPGVNTWHYEFPKNANGNYVVKWQFRKEQRSAKVVKVSVKN